MRCWCRFPLKPGRGKAGSGEKEESRESLLFLAVNGVAAQEGIKLLQLDPLFLELFILGAEVARGGFALRLGLCALQNDLLAHPERMPRECLGVKATGGWHLVRQSGWVWNFRGPEGRGESGSWLDRGSQTL